MERILPPNDHFSFRLPAPAGSTLAIRNVTIAGRRTSVRLEPEMWAAMGEICERENRSPHQICSRISERKHPQSSLTAAIRVFIMAYFRAAATEEGHRRAGHGPLDVAAATTEGSSTRTG